jgi:conjugative transfer signal peptidase TraF
MGGVAVALAGVYLAGGRVNVTKSIPRGLYWTISEPIEHGSYVTFCPPDNEIFKIARTRGYVRYGLCPGRYGYLMKTVAAMAGDTVTSSVEGVTVNGQKLNLSAPIVQDALGRALPTWNGQAQKLGSNELLLMSDTDATSFDSRYFGVIEKSAVQAVVQPIFIEKDFK